VRLTMAIALMDTRRSASRACRRSPHADPAVAASRATRNAAVRGVADRPRGGQGSTGSGVRPVGGDGPK
jgi:hypothetical protein